MTRYREQLNILPPANADPARNGRGRTKGFYLSRKDVAVCVAALGTILLAVTIGVYEYTKEKVIAEYVNSTAHKYCSLSSSVATAATPPKLDVRLPETLVPLYYKVELIPFVEPAYNFSLQGKVWIDVKCVRETDRVTLHIKNLTIFKATVSVWQVEVAELPVSQQRSSNSDVTVKGHTFDEIRYFYNIQVAPSLTPGRVYRIYIEYTGIMDESLGGFYRSSYRDTETNKTKYIGTTQFESTDARKAFPCFDEPQLKAKFEISLGRRENMSSMSNMDIRKTEPMQDMEGWEWDHFHKSVPMSTYLVAFVVSDFENRVAVRTLSRSMFRIWARKSAIHQVEYARDIGPRLLTFFEKYFGIDYPLPKLDMIAIPDFAAGAMENWGLVTYREIALLFDKTGSSDYNKMYIAAVISHEVSHQWFGNLVTAKWWNDLWLNEGFATYAEYIGADFINPDWKIMEQFVPDRVHEAFKLDALDATHPVSSPIHDPNEINQQFDSITYNKGASLIRMINHVLTDDSYKKGVHNYMIKWSYLAADEDELWIHLSQQAHSDGTLSRNISVGEVMKSWTRKIGYPLITVNRDYQNGSVTFSQAKFYMHQRPSQIANDSQSYRWWVPLSYATNAENSQFQCTTPKLWLSCHQTATTTTIAAPETSWLIVNVQQTGYYRVNYDAKNWQLITAQLLEKPTAIHTVNRAQLINDAFNLARAGMLEYPLVLDMSLFLQKDTEYLPWHAYASAIQYLSNMLSRSEVYGIFQRFVRQQLDKEYRDLDFFEHYSEPFLRKQHRVDIIRLACSVNHQDCAATSRRLFAAWMNKTEPDTDNPIPSNIQRVVYCTAIKYGGEQEWNFLWKRYTQSNLAAQRYSMIFALGCSKDEWLLTRYLHWASTAGSGIRKQDGITIFKSVSANEWGSLIAFNFIRERWSIINDYFGSEVVGLPDVIKYVVIRLSSPIELEELEQFQTQHRHQLGSVSRAVEQSIESVRNNVQWKEKNIKSICAWLENHYGKI